MKRYVKRPYVIHAMQWDGIVNHLKDTEIWQHVDSYIFDKGTWAVTLKTLEGNMNFHQGDYIRALKERNLPKKPKEVNEEEGHFVCPQCDHAIYFGDCPKEDHKYCLNCGQHLYWNGLRLPEKVVRAKRIELRKGYCPNCDWPVNDNDEKEECTRCGQKLDWSTENDE